MDSIDQFAKVGTEAALEAGRLLMRHFRTKFSIAHKGDINIVTELDVAAEKLIVSRILEAFPTHSVLAEENVGFEEVDGVRKHGIEHYLDMAADGKIDLSGMLTHQFRLDDWRSAFTTIARQEDTGAIKVAFDYR